jgi:regulator of telomere elongation helicase 1
MKSVKRSNSHQQQNNASTVAAPASVAPRKAVPKASPPTTLELRGVPIHFPFKPYKCQEDYMGKVLDALLRSENALLESPTGTGKTLCLLCAALAWQREQARELRSEDKVLPEFLNNNNNNNTNSFNNNKKQPHRVPTIIYASRTHSQLSQVVRELRSTRYRPKHAVLGSREQMCVHPKVKKATSTASEINHDCNKLGMERKCRFRNKLEGFVPSGDEFGFQPVMDMEDLLEMGNKHKVCPFYFTRGMVEDAELILVPYNYLFDKDSRSTTLKDVPWDNAVVIFDEAHNLESFASESASFDLTSLDIAGCVNEIQRAMGYIEMMGDQGERVKKENVIKLKSIFLNLEDYILNLDSKTAYRGEFMMEIFKKGATINHANHELFINEVRKLTDVFMEVKGGSNSRGAPKLEQFVQCVKRVYGEPTEARCIAKAQSYRVHVTPKNSSGNNTNGSTAGRTVSYWCFAPAEAMRELANLNVRSILVTSGTLSPLDSYALELDLPFPHRLENPHIIPDDQIHVRVLGKGVSGKLLTSSYERRQDDEYYTELGNTLVSLGKIVPCGMLVFFPSYSVMESCLEKWGGPIMGRSRAAKGKSNNFFAARKGKSTGTARYSFPYEANTFSVSREPTNPWRRLLGTKAVVVEPRSSADLPDAIAEFHKFLNMEKSKGVALFGVCRGKISEGIDFAHDMCRAVIITGLPFAPSFDPKVKMKREFLDQNRATQNFKAAGNGGFDSGKPKCVSISGHEWYTQQAHRAVNQAIGRVIRNKLDYGAILLLDSRFNLASNQEGLSKWVRPHLLPDEGVGKTIRGLSEFYKMAKLKAQSREKEPPAPPAPNEVSMILKYEDDGKENHGSSNEEEISTIAVVRRDQRQGMKSQQHAGSGIIPSPDKTYVNPDRIVARLDMNEREGAQKAAMLFAKKKDSSAEESKPAAPMQKKPESSSESTRPLPPVPSTPSSRDNSAEESKASVQVELKTPSSFSAAQSKQSGASPSQTIARQFFRQVQTRMSDEEQATVKKSVVAMKQFKEESQKDAFLKAAGAVIKVILNHDTFEGKSRQDKPELLSLLFQLLPKHFLVDVERRTAYLILLRSEFIRIAKAKVISSLWKKYVQDCGSLTWELWFGEKSTDDSGYLQKLKALLQPILSGSKLTSVLSSVLQVIPLEKHRLTNAFFEELKASQSISRIKGNEKEQCGERAVNTDLFRRRVIQQQQSSEDAKATNPLDAEDSGNKGNEETHGNAPTGNNDQLKKRVNPYAKPGDAAVNRKTSEDETKRRPQKVRRGVSLKSLVSHQQKSASNHSNPVQRAVQESASGTYTGVTSTRKIAAIEQSKFTCPFCEVRFKNVSIEADVVWRSKKL